MDKLKPTQEMLESTRLISMSEAAYWTAIQAAEQRGKERERERCLGIADEQAQFHEGEMGVFNDKGQIQYRDFAKMRADKCRSIAQAIRQGEQA